MHRLIYILVALSISIHGSPLGDTGGRIVGGEVTSIKEHPHQVSFHYNQVYRCGGIIIDRCTILTAAHCSRDAEAKYITIRVGSDYRDKYGAVHQVKECITHEKYGVSSGFSHDFALCKLQLCLEYNENVAPVKLCDRNQKIEHGDNCTTTGWGLTLKPEESRDVIRAVDVKCIDNEICAKAYGNIYEVDDSMICAGVDGGGKDACSGDSGGPMTCNGCLWGVVSWGIGCAEAKHPGVYSRVPYVMDWIEEHTKDGCSCSVE